MKFKLSFFVVIKYDRMARKAAVTEENKNVVVQRKPTYLFFRLLLAGKIKYYRIGLTE